MYFKVHKKRNVVYSRSYNSIIEKYARNCYWLECTEGNIPDPYGVGDNILFVLNIQLTDEELKRRDVVKQISDGSFEHSLTEAEVAEIEKEMRNLAKRKDHGVIMSEIFRSFTSTEQQNRLISTLNNHPVFLLFLERYNYQEARSVLSAVLNAGEITQEDYGLIDGIIPVYET